MQIHTTLAALAMAAVVAVSAGSAGCEQKQSEPEAARAASAAATDSKPNEADETILGHFRYMADAGLFRVCGAEEEFPVATEGDNASLERAYRAHATKPAERVLVRLEANFMWKPVFDPATGRAAGGKERAWYVERFLGLAPGDCPAS